jgi:hypothetical protein
MVSGGFIVGYSRRWGYVVSGVKHDGGKPKLSLVPRGLLEACARGMEYGLGKYGRDNWRGGFADSRLLDAALRHLVAYANGERDDRESGLSHIDHAICMLAFLADQLRQRADGKQIGDDDVYISS